MSSINIVVCVKQVLETRLALEINQESGVLQKEPWPVYVINPADRCALEEAIRLRDSAGGTVTAITLGPVRSDAALAHCLARGADRAIHLVTDEAMHLDSLSVAQVLRAEIKKLGSDLVLCGNKAEDDGASEVGAVLAELLNTALVTNAVKITLTGDKLKAIRKLERGNRQEIETNIPAVVTVDNSICQPRYVTVRASQYKAQRISQDAEQIRVNDSALLEYGSNLRYVVDITPPKPRPKKIAQAAGASGADKLAALMGLGGPAPKKPAQSNGPDSLADEIIDYLKEKGLLV